MGVWRNVCLKVTVMLTHVTTVFGREDVFADIYLHRCLNAHGCSYTYVCICIFHMYVDIYIYTYIYIVFYVPR